MKKGNEPQQQGFFANLNNSLQGFAKEFERGVQQFVNVAEREIDYYSAPQTQEQFIKIFKLPSDEILLDSFGTNAISGKNVITGVAFVSSRHFCFMTLKASSNVRVKLPWLDIIQVNRVFNVQAAKQGMFPDFKVVLPNAPAHGIQFLTKDKMLHHFFGIVKGLSNGAFQQFYNLVTFSWTSVVKAHAAGMATSNPVHGGNPISVPTGTSTTSTSQATEKEEQEENVDEMEEEELGTDENHQSQLVDFSSDEDVGDGAPLLG
eukprot:TRINITY_DN7239_c0_g1_i1.p1 TRINITY_DN7239_c0_g1~~TRINITY_DN7239_c0_g1_i1.p1  ORF type:complete len:262 (+),score=64.39 TRINITY_DN7239_c0_g1_i1:1217-2002(+)